MSSYEDWKIPFAYAQQRTVIDVACELTVSQGEEETLYPEFCGRPLQTCEHDLPCDSLGDHDDHIK